MHPSSPMFVTPAGAARASRNCLGLGSGAGLGVVTPKPVLGGGGAGDARHFATTINTTIHEHMFPLRNSLTLQLPSSHAHHSGPHHCHANSHTRNCSRRQALEAPPWSLRRPILPTLILMIPSQTQESSGLPCGSQHPKHEAVLALVAQVVELKPQHKQLPGT